MSDALHKIADTLLQKALKNGADAADIVVSKSKSKSVDIRNGALESVQGDDASEIGLRVFIGKRSATVSASEFKDATLETLSERALAMAKLAPEDPYAILAEPDAFSERRDNTGLDLVDPAPAPEMNTLQNLALEAEAEMLAYKGVSKSLGTASGYGEIESFFLTSKGFTAFHKRTQNYISAGAIAGETTSSMERDSAGEARIYFSDLPSPKEIGQKAAKRTVERLGARKPPTGRFPVIYDERISSGFIGHLISAANGAALARGSSWLSNKMGEQILPKALSLTLTPHRSRIAGSRYFDGEGLATKELDIIKDGVLKSWYLDLRSANQLGLESTGNAARSGSGAPHPSAGNFALTPSDKTQQDLLKDMGTGLLITSMIGSSINPTTGDYSRGASGFWVENGDITYPVNECTLAGNLLTVLPSLIAANDLDPMRGSQVPSLLVEGFTIAGA